MNCAPEPGYQQNARVNNEHHNRIVPGYDLLRLNEHPVETSGSIHELFVLVLFAHEALYNADTGNILLNAGIEVVVPRENLVEHLGSLGNDDSKNGSQNHHRAEEYQADAHVNEHTHYNAAYEHDRSSYSNAYYHLERVLEIGDVGGHTCNETGGAELIYV